LDAPLCAGHRPVGTRRRTEQPHPLEESTRMKSRFQLGGGVSAPPLLGRSAIALYSVGLAYGGGLWLHLLHEAEGATELNAPPGIIHWLRDSSLSLPLLF